MPPVVPIDTTPGCSLTAPNKAALGIVAALLRLPRSMAMSNALLVDAAHSATGHPIAVFGPQVGYFAPQILMEEDLHSPGIAAEGAAFPGISFVVQLGRGPDFAWSATSAESDVVDQRLELICNPSGGPPAPQGIPQTGEQSPHGSPPTQQSMHGKITPASDGAGRRRRRGATRTAGADLA